MMVHDTTDTTIPRIQGEWYWWLQQVARSLLQTMDTTDTTDTRRMVLTAATGGRVAPTNHRHYGYHNTTDTRRMVLMAVTGGRVAPSNHGYHGYNDVKRPWTYTGYRTMDLRMKLFSIEYLVPSTYT